MVPSDLYYTKEHEWVKATDEGFLVGITDYAQEQLGDIVYVELPEIDEDYVADETAVVIESVKTASDVYMPVSGTVISVNEELEEQPELINEDCYGNYIFKIKPKDEQDLDELLTAAEYSSYLKGEKDE